MFNLFTVLSLVRYNQVKSSKKNPHWGTAPLQIKKVFRIFSLKFKSFSWNFLYNKKLNLESCALLAKVKLDRKM